MSALSLLSLGTLADQLGVSRPTLRRLYRRGIIPADFESNHEILFDASRLDSLRAVVIASRNRNPEPQPII